MSTTSALYRMWEELRGPRAPTGQWLHDLVARIAAEEGEPVTMHPFVAFYWRDEPILDIDAWARERNERMVVVEETRKVANVFAGRFDEQKTVTRMPESFYRTMRWDADVKRRVLRFEDPKGGE